MFAARGIPVQDRPSSPRAGVGGLHSPPMSPIPRHQQLPHSQPALPPPAPTFPSLPTPQASAQPWTTISSPFDHSWSSRTSPSPHFSEPRPYTAPMLPSSHSTPLQSDHQATFKDWTATALAEEASLEEVKTSAPTNQSPSRIEASASQPSLEWDPSEWEAELMVPSNQASKKRKAFATESPPGQGAPEQEADLMFPRDQAPKKLKTTASHHREIPLPSPIITRSKVSHRTTFWKLGQSFRHGQGAAVRSTRVRKPSTTSQGMYTLWSTIFMLPLMLINFHMLSQVTFIDVARTLYQALNLRRRVGTKN